MDFESFAQQAELPVERVPHLLSAVQKEVASILSPGDLAIDATAGNGNDSLFLVTQTGPGGFVWIFDIQEEALQSTQKRLTGYGFTSGFQLVHAGHETMTSIIPPENHGKIAAVMFNLGYLPGGNHTVTTQVSSTVEAIRQATEVIRPSGVVTVTFYPGHEEGTREAEEAIRWLKDLKRQFSLELKVFGVGKTLRPAPFSLIIKKTGQL